MLDSPEKIDTPRNELITRATIEQLNGQFTDLPDGRSVVSQFELTPWQIHHWCIYKDTDAAGLAHRMREGALKMTTTYTVFSPANGTEYGRGLTAREAMAEVLSHDGQGWEIRPASYGHQLFVTSSADRHKMVECWSGTGSNSTFIDSFETDLEKATDEIAEKVCRASWLGQGHPDVMTDPDYDAMLAEAAAE